MTNIKNKYTIRHFSYRDNLMCKTVTQSLADEGSNYIDDDLKLAEKKIKLEVNP